MVKDIVSIGFDIAHDHVQYEGFRSKKSLLDYDIALFKPIDILALYSGDKNTGFDDDCLHWKEQISLFCKEGKTVVILLSSLNLCYVKPRNAEPYACDNYNFLPLNLKLKKNNGKKMELKNSEILSSYWEEFKSCSEYKVMLEGVDLEDQILTKLGNKVVGGINRSEEGGGAILLLPYIDFDNEKYTDTKIVLGNKKSWTKEGKQFGASFIKAIVGIDKSLKSSKDKDALPMPEWSCKDNFKLQGEDEIYSEISKIEKQIKELQDKESEERKKLDNKKFLRNLLFANGKPLEQSVIEALKILGFEASNYRDSKSEFDVLFSSDQGRFIGEVEGKNNKAVDIGKMRQLQTNIIEDNIIEEYKKEGNSKSAKGVLFGNGKRLLEPSERGEDIFTEKCLSYAKGQNIALVFTPDLFDVVQYLSKNKDDNYIIKCREVILNSSGMVKFPQRYK